MPAFDLDNNQIPPRPGLNPQLLIALLGALIFHGGLSVFGTYRYTYDAYVHIFFADHWTRGWFDHWDPRWYTGFTLTSYPPLSQQSVALLSFLTDDLRLAFALVQTAAIIVMALGMYRFARIWVSEEAAGWAAVWLVFSSAMAETIHVFGQLPTTYSLGLLLNALPFAYAWIDRGRYSDLIKAWALMAATTGAHHVTTLFGSVFITSPVIALAILQHFRTPLPDEPRSLPMLIDQANWRALIVRRLRRILNPTVRSAIFGFGTIFLLLLVVFPYWAWSKADPITQVPIPHASRDNFLQNLNAGLVFWLIPYGMLLFGFPYIFYKGSVTKAWPLTASIAFLALLGTGGTTPIPKMLLGGAFDILTLDRFTLWASILMLPLAGEFVISLRHRGLARWLTDQFGRLTWRAVQVALVVGLLIFTIFTVSLTQFRRFQPDPIDTSPILNFISKDEHWRWRYLTLGFGDQMAWLSAQTTAVQIDGNYHSARRLPELTTTPVERLEGAKFRGIPGIGSLQQFLTVPDKFNLKFVFANDRFYDPLLYFYGWHQLQRLENGIVVWERADIPTLPEFLPRKEVPLYHRWMFGLLPVGALISAILAVTAGYWSLPFRLLTEFLGISSLLRRLPRPKNSLPQRFWQTFDQRLLLLSQIPDRDSAPYPPWQVWLRFARRFSLKRMKPASPTARQVRTGLLAVTLLVLVVTGYSRYHVYQSNPIKAVEAYYDDLDFRRFEAAHARLNPQTRPNFDQYLLQLSVTGGIVASYGKLDSLYTTVLNQEPNYMEVQVQTTLITSLSYYTDTVTHVLTRLDDNHWYIEPDPVSITVPPEQFVRQPTLNWLAQDKNRVGADKNGFDSLVDRPELNILSARLVQTTDQQYSVVGEVQNIDADPADLTVTALLYDHQNEELTRYNANSGMIHKLLPLEITPFRVDFEGVSGLVLDKIVDPLDFNPAKSWGFTLPDDVQLEDFAVYAKAVLTQHDLERALGVQNMAVAVDPVTRQLMLHGQVINHGITEAIVPHVLLTLYDEAGQVMWVEHHLLRESVRSQRTLDFVLPIAPVESLRVWPQPGNLYPAKPMPVLEQQQLRSDFIELPAGFGYRYLRVSINYFTGGIG